MLLILEGVDYITVRGIIPQSFADVTRAGSPDGEVRASGFVVLLVLVGVLGAVVSVPRPIVGSLARVRLAKGRSGKQGLWWGALRSNKSARFGSLCLYHLQFNQSGSPPPLSACNSSIVPS